MKREDVKNVLGENATDEQISNLLNLFHSNEKTLKDEIANKDKQLSKYSDYDDLKSKMQKIEDEKLTEQERIAKEKEEIARQLKSAKLTNNTAKAKEILAGTNISDKLLARLVDEDLDITISNANEYLTGYNSLKDDVEKKTKESLSSLNVKPNINDKDLDSVMTWDKFTTLSQEEQSKFQTEHPTEFENL